MGNKKQKFIYILPIILISFLVAIDQLTKYIVRTSFKLYESKPLIKGVFELSYIRNEGVAWGMFAGKRIIFLLITVVVLLGCLYIYSNIDGIPKYKLLRIVLVILIAGAIGNMIDRIRYGYVVDFFYFKLIDFPVFNVADIYVVISMISMFLLFIFKYTNDDFDEILGSKKSLDNTSETAECIDDNIDIDKKDI